MLISEEQNKNTSFSNSGQPTIVSIPKGTDLNKLSRTADREELLGTVSSPVVWPQPQPIVTELLPVLPMREEMLPEPLRAWLVDIANRMKCPLDFVAAAAIVMLSSLIGTRLAIKPKTRDDWTITPNLWGGVIGDPSAMKTPSVQEVFKPLNRLMAEAQKQYREAVQRYQMEQVTYEAQKKAHAAQEQKRIKGDKIDKPICYPESPCKPTERRYMTNDATIEKLADLLNENPTGLLQYRDELTGLLAGWERAGREEDRAFYLEAWNGNGSKTVDRIGRGTIHVSNLCVSLFGGIQPVKLLGYLRAATGYDNDGFVQRLQVAVYPDKPTWAYVDEYPDKAARDKAFTVIEQLANADLSALAYDANEYDRYPYTRFDSEGQAVFKEWLTHLETVVLPAESGLLLEHFTKYRSLMPSLALILHVVDCVGSETPFGIGKQLVTAQAARMAVAWIEYLGSQARRIYGLLDTQSQESAKTLLSHLKAGHLKDGFKARQVVQKGWSGLDQTALVEDALTVLVSHHWLRAIEPQEPTEGRPPAPSYAITPYIIPKA